MANYTEAETEAMRIAALLAGASDEDLAGLSIYDDEEGDEEEIEVEVIEKSKKQKKKKDNNAPVTVVHYIEEREEFKNIKRNESLNVVVGGHELYYGGSNYPIPTRTIEYNIDIVKMPKQAEAVAEMFHGNSSEEKKKAYDGDVRYFKLVTYESVKSEIRELGYIKVFVENNRLKTKTMINKEIAKKNHINIDKLSDELKRKAQKIVSNQ